MKMTDVENCACEYSKELLKVCELSAGFSGRTLRKVPFIAHALFSSNDCITLQEFLNHMIEAVNYLRKERKHFEEL